jgi:hypothetical protein
LQAYWITCSHHGLDISAGYVWFLLNIGPQSLASLGSSSHELDLFFRVYDRLEPARASPKTTSTFPGVFVPIATTMKRAFLRCRSNQTSTDDAHEVSHLHSVRTLNTLWVCFAPQPRPGFTFQGFSPLFSRHNSSKCRPLITLSNSLLPPSKLVGTGS